MRTSRPAEHPTEHPAGSAAHPAGRPAPGPGRASAGGRSDIATILARLVAGDHAAVLVLVDDHHDRLVAALLAGLRRCGVPAPSPAELAALVLVTGFAIADAAASAAGGERPGAADPWGWIAARAGELVATWATPEGGLSSVGGDVAAPRPTRHTDLVSTPARSVALPSAARPW